MEGNTANVTIGGNNLAARNIISGNYWSGIALWHTSAITIDGNLIGLDASFNSMYNRWSGIEVSFSDHITIGSSDHTLIQQFISGNLINGIQVSESNHVDIQDSNLIGVSSWTSDLAADTPAGNGWNGIFLYHGSTYVDVDSWKIAYNGRSGISSDDEGAHPILYNRLMPKNIYANGWLPIDLGDDGATPNDPGDVDNGENDLLNYPVITSVSGNMIGGQACVDCIIYFYRIVSNPGLYGGGVKYDLHMEPVVTSDGGSNWTAYMPSGIRPWNISMLAADPLANQTSEFSPVYSINIPLIKRP